MKSALSQNSIGLRLGGFAGIIGALVFWILASPSNTMRVPSTPPIVWTVPSLVRIGQNDAAGPSYSASLYAAKGEYQAFQVAVKAPAEGLTGVNATVSDLEGAGGAVIPRSNLTLYREHYVYVSKASKDSGGPNHSDGVGWYPDGLIPFVNPKTGSDLSGSPDAVPFNLPAGQNAVVWVDVGVPRTAVAGEYSGNLSVTSTEGNVQVPVSLTVWNFTFPVKPALKTSFQYYYNSPGSGMTSPDAGTLEAQRELLRNLITPMWVDNSSLPEFVNYGVTAKDLRFWSGANWTNCVMNPMPSVSDFGSASSGIPSGVWVYNYTADEILPGCENLFPQIRAWARNLHAAGINQLITMPPTPALYDDGSGTGRSVVDAWVVLPRFWNSADVAFVQNKGDEVWSYTALDQDGYSPKWQIDYNSVNYRIWGFINAALGLKGVLYWRVDGWHASDPWNNVNNTGMFDADTNYPGEGMLVYPGTPIGLPGTVTPSMRLKYLRSAVEDYEYVAMLRNQGYGAWALSLVPPIASSWSSWTHDSAAIESVRLQLGQKLDQLAGGSDTQPPSTPANVKAIAVPPSSVSLSWTASSDNAGVAGYYIYRNRLKVGSTPNTSYQDVGLPSGAYHYTVAAYDEAGNVSSPSTAVSVYLQAASVPHDLAAGAVSPFPNQPR